LCRAFNPKVGDAKAASADAVGPSWRAMRRGGIGKVKLEAVPEQI
jgi:hypothetical protein